MLIELGSSFMNDFGVLVVVNKDRKHQSIHSKSKDVYRPATYDFVENELRGYPVLAIDWLARKQTPDFDRTCTLPPSITRDRSRLVEVTATDCSIGCISNMDFSFPN